MRPTLKLLKSAGLRLAVISNWDERLVPLLERLDLAHYFEVTFVSSVVGAPKPAAKIFNKAAEHFRFASERDTSHRRQRNRRCSRREVRIFFTPAGFADKARSSRAT